MGCKACQKPKVQYRKGLWSPEEDQKLQDFIIRYGHGCWSALPAKAGKSCMHFEKRISFQRNRGKFSEKLWQALISLQRHASCFFPRCSQMYLCFWETEMKGSLAASLLSFQSSKVLQFRVLACSVLDSFVKCTLALLCAESEPSLNCRTPRSAAQRQELPAEMAQLPEARTEARHVLPGRRGDSHETSRPAG
jgi:hypothetical protein